MALYGPEAWSMRSAERKKVNVLEMKSLRSLVGVSRMAEVSGGRVRGRPRLGWMDGVKVALGNRVMPVEAAQQCAKDRKAWRALVHM